MAQFLTQMEFWQWWAIGLVLIGLEIAVPGTFFMFLGIGAGLVGLIMLPFPDMSWQAQLIIFAGTSLAAAIGFRLWQRKNPPEVADETLNRRGAQHIGQTVIVSDTMKGGRGRVTLGDSSWSCVSEDGSDFIAGAKVEITDVQGATLTVKAAH